MDEPNKTEAVHASGRQKYLETLGLSKATDKKLRAAALERAHVIRQFEIELYWKRANYFWLLQAAVFTAVALTIGNDAVGFRGLLPLTLSTLGFLTAWTSWLAGLSSKFWQRNWEHHIDMLEAEFEGNLYKTVYVSRSGSKWSLTSLNENLILLFSIFWIFVALFASISANANWDFTGKFAKPNVSEVITVLIWILAGIGAVYLVNQKSGVSGNRELYPESMENAGVAMDNPKLFGPRIRPYLIRREPGITESLTHNHLA